MGLLLSLPELKAIYLREIVDCLDFWLTHSVDRKYGGYLSYLDRTGKVYGTDKSIWAQGRMIYIFSKAYNCIEKRPEWLEAARIGYEFLIKYGYDADKRMFFIVTQDGHPVQKRRYYFSETFAVVGCAEYYRASGDMEALKLAQDTYDKVLYLYENPQVLPPKFNPEVVKSKALAVPMIITATAQILREADPVNAGAYSALIDRTISEILRDFQKTDEKILFETVGPQGERLNSPAGRLINPGHVIEAAWFLMSEGIRNEDKGLIGRSLEILNNAFDMGWDVVHGGLMYFMDIEGKPVDKLEWDMKLWWPHSEALIAYLMAFRTTNERSCLDRFQIVHDYTFSHFRDWECGEWYGYLHRDGTVANTLKGNLFKSAFHMCRALMLCYLIMTD